MARLKDFDRFDDVFMPPIEVNIFQKLARYAITSLCELDCLLLTEKFYEERILRQQYKSKVCNQIDCVNLTTCLSCFKRTYPESWVASCVWGTRGGAVRCRANFTRYQHQQRPCAILQPTAKSIPTVAYLPPTDNR
jgi:hypothetical protein